MDVTLKGDVRLKQEKKRVSWHKQIFQITDNSRDTMVIFF